MGSARRKRRSKDALVRLCMLSRTTLPCGVVIVGGGHTARESTEKRDHTGVDRRERSKWLKVLKAKSSLGGRAQGRVRVKP